MLRMLIGILLWTAAAPGWAAMVGFDLSGGSTFAPGQQFTLTLEGSGFTEPLDGGGVNLQFNPAVLQVESLIVDTTVWDFAPSNGTVDNNSGVVDDVLFNALLNPSPSGTFNIASVQFLAESAGTSSLLLTPSALNPFSSGGITLAPGSDFTFQSATITVAPVPLPGTLELLASALFFLAAARAVARPHNRVAAK